MKNLRKILCCVLSVLMLSGMLLTAPATANATETNIKEVGATDSGTTGSCTWNLDITTGVLSITGTGAMGNYSWSSDVPWYSYRSYVETVTISNGVTSICSSAFQNCTGLTSVTIPGSVTSIGSDAFCYCTSLTSVTIPSSVTSIGSGAFYYCTSLTSVTIPSSVTSIGSYAFRYCTSLTSISVNSNNTKYSSINGNLYNKNQTKLIQYAIGKTATSFTIPSSVKRIGSEAFENCTSLTSVTIPSSVTSIGSDVFCLCTSLTSVTIPSSVTSIGGGVFYSCTSLTSVTIPSSVTSIGSYAFEGCTSLTSISVNSNNTKYSSINGNLYNKDQTTLIQYAIGKTATSFTIPSSVTSIGDGAFQNCTSLTSVTIPRGAISIGSYAFGGCTSLTGVTIPSSVTSIGYSAFRYCTSLTSVTIPSSVTSIDVFAFYDCSSLKNVYYTGTASDWNNISIGTNNTPLTSATIYYSVEETETTEPTETQATQPTVCTHKSTWTRGKKSATYFEKGYTGDKVCNNCGKVVSKGRSVAKKVLATPKTTIKSRGNSIVISYTKVKGAHGFEMECKFGSKKYSQKIKTTKSKTITLSNIKRGIKATVKVRAFATSGKKKAYSNWTKTKTLKIK